MTMLRGMIWRVVGKLEKSEREKGIIGKELCRFITRCRGRGQTFVAYAQIFCHRDRSHPCPPLLPRFTSCHRLRIDLRLPPSGRNGPHYGRRYRASRSRPTEARYAYTLWLVAIIRCSPKEDPFVAKTIPVHGVSHQKSVVSFTIFAREFRANHVQNRLRLWFLDENYSLIFVREYVWCTSKYQCGGSFRLIVHSYTLRAIWNCIHSNLKLII